MKKLIILFALPILLSQPANALVELRVGYGVQTPADANIAAGTTLAAVNGFNLDAIFEIPMVPVGLGIRHEVLSSVVENALGNTDTDITRTSLIVNYRIIDLFAYFGVIGTIGFLNTAEASFSPPLVPVPVTAEFDSDFTYSVGVEGGFSFGLIMVGAELGYMSGTFSESTSFGFSDLDPSGVYAKAMVGIGL